MFHCSSCFAKKKNSTCRVPTLVLGSGSHPHRYSLSLKWIKTFCVTFSLAKLANPQEGALCDVGAVKPGCTRVS